MKQKWLIIGIILFCVIACIIPSIAEKTEQSSQPTSKGNWLYVGGSGPENYTKIQGAINDASDGDTVYVYNDSSPYNESLWIKKSIQLIGENKETTIIDGNGSDYVVFVDESASFVTIQGLTITHADHGIHITSFSYNNTIVGNIIVSNKECGIIFFHTKNNIIKNNTILDNGIGIFFELCEFNTIRCNTLENNRNNSIHFTQSDHTLIEDNIIENLSLMISGSTILRRNNFIGQTPHVRCILSFGTTWDANYWDNWIGLKLSAPLFQKFPKVILAGFLIQFDLHPAQEPYDI